MKLNPQLCFIDQKGNSIFHCLISFIFENKISIDKKTYVIKEILDKLKDNISDDELNRICNSYDENGFTPLLKLMYEYHNQIILFLRFLWSSVYIFSPILKKFLTNFFRKF